MIFPVALKGEDFLIERPDTHGGNQTFASFEDLEKEFAAEKVLNNSSEPSEIWFLKLDLLKNIWHIGFREWIQILMDST